MKIALITLHRVYNYGSAFQAYATQEVFRRLGHDVSVIDYVTPQRTKKRLLLTTAPATNKSKLSMLLYRCMKMGSVLLKEYTFGRFIRKNLNLTKKYITVEELEKEPPCADLYVTGSDQVWNSQYNEGVDRGFFLDFLPEEARRLAFVSSFGKSVLDEEECGITGKYLMRYGGISVREDSARLIAEKLGRPDAIQLIDPTLQLKKEFWLEIASGRLIRDRYLLLFLLYNEDNHATEYARQIADRLGLKVVTLSWQLVRPPIVDKLMTHRSPMDFLSLMHYADFVVTNSFHGLAFSINLEKQFIVVPRNEFNSRIESLLRLTGLEHRMVGAQEDLSVAFDVIDYTPVGKVLEKERERAESFIRTHIGRE